MKNNQTLIILTGNIGCGKSTFAADIVTNDRSFIIINDDCITTMFGGGVYTNYDENKRGLYKDIEGLCASTGLSLGYNVIIDMPNMKIKSRKFFIDIGKRYNVDIISFDWGPGKNSDLLRRLSDNRGYNRWKKAFKKKYEEYEKPSLNEGFDKIIIMDYNNE
jgi:tRNA uridine 5-carbamoylmethylation protein Kti12